VKQLVYDIETRVPAGSDNPLLDSDKIWCVVTQDLQTGEISKFGPDEIDSACEHLCSADQLIAHNGRMFDDRVVRRYIAGRFSGGGKSLDLTLPPSVDTLLLSRLVYPDKFDNPIGGHSLDAWGQYLGFPKLKFHDWSGYSQEMMTYCVRDVEVTTKVYQHLLPKATQYGYAVKLEHRVADIIAAQIENGVEFFQDRAEALVQDITIERAKAMDELAEVEPWVEVVQLKTPHFWYHPDGRTFKLKGECPAKDRKDLLPGPPRFKCEVEEFNPNSGDHIARLFMEKYGWKPTKFTEPTKRFPTGKVVTDDKVIAALRYPEADAISRVKLCDKRLSQIVQWTNNARGTRVHGSVITNGCVSGRMSHSRPNMAQIPKTQKQSGLAGGWGSESRTCFGPRRGWKQVGCDASGLELRMLAHYMARWDGGAYAKVVLEGDIHTENQTAAGLSTRDQAKTFISMG
jgi:DNA polymerase-1